MAHPAPSRSLRSLTHSPGAPRGRGRLGDPAWPIRACQAVWMMQSRLVLMRASVSPTRSAVGRRPARPSRTGRDRSSALATCRCAGSLARPATRRKTAPMSSEQQQGQGGSKEEPVASRRRRGDRRRRARSPDRTMPQPGTRRRRLGTPATPAATDGGTEPGTSTGKGATPAAPARPGRAEPTAPTAPTAPRPRHQPLPRRRPHRPLPRHRSHPPHPPPRSPDRRPAHSCARSTGTSSIRSPSAPITRRTRCSAPTAGRAP